LVQYYAVMVRVCVLYNMIHVSGTSNLLVIII
jgi:hypothetical protein